MDEQPDRELIELVKNDKCSLALKALTDRHGGIYNKTSKNIFKNPDSRDYLDMMDDMPLNFYNFCLTWKEELSKFVTYVGNQTRYLCLNRITKKSKRELKEVFFDDEHFDLADYHVPQELNLSYLTEQLPGIVNSLNDRTREIIIRRFLNPEKETLKTIARSYNISGQAVLNIQNHGLQYIRSRIQTLV